ncbi:MAG: hypothetical protein E6R07_14570 [Nevskiaceae bacterium]|nr:MAG: hypothetical protein E6R07_14570 [Nevskiaceae bacterium]
MSSTELEIRVTAQLSEIRAALAQLSGQFQQVNTKAQQSANGANALTSSLNRTTAAARQTATAAESVRSSIAGAVTQARLLVAGIGVLGAIKALVNYADTATRLRGQLTLATKSQEEFNRAQAQTFVIAQRTRQSLEGTVNLYARIARAGRTTQQQTLGLTEAINQAVALSFTTAQAGEAALFQLGQGLASGQLRGEELNSVLEQTPRLASAIAEGLVKLGQIKTTDQLRKFAADGKLTSDLVVQAIQTQQQTLRDEFAKLPPTVSDAFTSLRNAVIKFVGDTDSAHGASRQLADAILALANNLQLVANLLLTGAKLWVTWYAAFRLVPAIVAGAAAAFTALRTSIALNTPAMRAFQVQALALTTTINGTTTAVNAFSLSMNGSALAAAGWATKLKAAAAVAFAAFTGWEIGTYLSNEFVVVRQAGVALTAGLTKAANIIKNSFIVTWATLKAGALGAFNEVATRVASFYDSIQGLQRAVPLVGDKLANASARVSQALRDSVVATETMEDAYKRTTATAQAELAQIDSAYFDLFELAGQANKAAEDTLDGDASGGGTAKGAKAAADQFKLLKDAAERALVVLQQRYDDWQVSTREYYAEKTRLQQASIDADIAEARARAATATTDQARKAALTDIIILERARRNLAQDNAREQRLALEEISKELGAVQIRILQAMGQTGKATTAQLESEFLELKSRLMANADQDGIDLVNKLIDMETFKARLDEVDQRVQQTVQRFQQTETAVGAQVDAGILGKDDGSARVQAQRETALATLVKMRDEYQAIAVAARQANDAMSEQRAVDSLQEINGQIAQMAINTDSLGYKATQVLKGSVTQLFTDLASGTKSAGESLRDFVVNFARGMAQIAADALATYLVLQLLDAIYPGLGKMTASLAGATAHHSGGIAGQGYQRRELPAYLWSAAPRYHTGGVAGLAPDEVPAVLQKGEEVITRMDPRHRLNGGRDGEPGSDGATRIVLVDDSRSAEKFLESAAGERIVVRHMQRNRLTNANKG